MQTAYVLKRGGKGVRSPLDTRQMRIYLREKLQHIEKT